jgi:hypothetical protein
MSCPTKRRRIRIASSPILMQSFGGELVRIMRCLLGLACQSIQLVGQQKETLEN